MSNTYPPGTVFKPTPELFYVGLYEEDDQACNFMGKLVINKNDHHATSYKPSNATAAFLLYLLFREEDEKGISIDQIIAYISKKFQNVVGSQIHNFIKELEHKKAIDVFTAGDTTVDPDPCGICKAPLWLPFGNPTLVNAKDSDVRHKMAYGRGQYFYTIRR